MDLADITRTLEQPPMEYVALEDARALVAELDKTKAWNKAAKHILRKTSIVGYAGLAIDDNERIHKQPYHWECTLCGAETRGGDLSVLEHNDGCILKE